VEDDRTIIEHEEPIQQPFKIMQVKDPDEPAIDATSIKEIPEIDTAKKDNGNVEQLEKSPSPQVEAAEVKEQTDSPVKTPVVKDDRQEDVAVKRDHNADLYKEPSTKIAKAVIPPMKTYDFGFKISKSYFGNTTNETVAVVDGGSDKKFDIEQLVNLASRWLETVNK